MAVKKHTNNHYQRRNFLSRLCGGEAILIPLVKLFIFLSRLCGGEDGLAILFALAVFLSRLCGGED